MKHLYKIILSLAVIAFFSSCDNSEGDNEGKFDDNPETGWVDFFNPATSFETQIDDIDTSTPTIVGLPVGVNVPVNKNDLTINYSFVPVSGPDPNNFFSNNGRLIAEGGKSSTFGNYYPEIEIDLSEAAAIDDVMEFDIVLNSTNRSFVTAGIAGGNRLTSIRYVICPSLSAENDQFLGDYILTVPTGDGPFGTVFTDGQTVTLSQGNDGSFSRVFSSLYLEFAPITLAFSFVDGQIVVNDGSGTGIGCASQILVGGNQDNILSQPCGDESIELNLYDFQDGSGGCGQADVPMTVLLSKV